MKKNFLRNNNIFRLIVIMLVLLYGLTRSYGHLKSSEFGLLFLDNKIYDTNLTNTDVGELLKGNTVQGKFNSKYRNLGIVSIRFDNHNRDSEDILRFRIKESGDDVWYYKSEYKTDQFLPHKLFPFGFPIINNSEDKVYEFEIESLKGTSGSGIYIDPIKPIFVAKSSFSKEDLLSNKELLSYFIKNKIINIFNDKDDVIYIFLSFYPLILCTLYLFFGLISAPFIVCLVLYIFVCKILGVAYDTYILYGLAFFLISLIYRFKIQSKVALKASITLIVLTSLLLLFKMDYLAEKLSIWIYVAICSIAILQVINQEK